MSRARSSDPTAPKRLLGRARKRLLAWYDANKRDLPWRRTRDPYAIWVSETMLQQTRVETVIPYYERFLARYPDVESLASADLDDVYSLWTGLGYYSRARNLHAAAGNVVRDHHGALPAEVEALRGLEGIGRYTAGALASIAFGREEPLVDGNVIRVLARLLGIREDVGQRQVVESFWRHAGELVKGPRPGDLNQALMELGATLCTPKSPSCPSCPLRTDCNALAAGDAETLPVKQKKPKAKRIVAAAAWLERRGRVLAVKRAEGGLLGGMWELPSVDVAAGHAPDEVLVDSVRAYFGLSIRTARYLGEVEHLFTHRRLALHVFECPEPTGRVRRGEYAEHRWVAPADWARLAHGGPTRKALALLGAGATSSHRERVRAASRGASA